MKITTAKSQTARATDFASAPAKMVHRDLLWNPEVGAAFDALAGALGWRKDAAHTSSARYATASGDVTVEAGHTDGPPTVFRVRDADADAICQAIKDAGLVPIRKEEPAGQRITLGFPLRRFELFLEDPDFEFVTYVTEFGGTRTNEKVSLFVPRDLDADTIAKVREGVLERLIYGTPDERRMVEDPYRIDWREMLAPRQLQRPVYAPHETKYIYANLNRSGGVNYYTGKDLDVGTVKVGGYVASQQTPRDPAPSRAQLQYLAKYWGKS